MRRRVATDEVGEKVTTHQVRDGQLDEEHETTNHVMAVRNALKDTGEVNFLKFIVDPSSFSQTVENLFHFSFLVAEGGVQMRIKHDQPVIRTREVRDQDRIGRKQCIVRLDHDTWQVGRRGGAGGLATSYTSEHCTQKMSRLADSPIIPHREYSASHLQYPLGTDEEEEEEEAGNRSEREDEEEPESQEEWRSESRSHKRKRKKGREQ